MQRALLLLVLSAAFVSFIASDNSEEHLLKITDAYKTYGISRKNEYRYKPVACAPRATPEDQNSGDSILFSSANPVMSGHGEKMYRLYVKNLFDYKMNFTQPSGQELVKEVWEVARVSEDSVRYYPNARKHPEQGVWFRPVRPSQLFVMYKTEADSTNDNGWTYGIVDLSTKKVLQKGRLQNCMSCHDKNGDRVFRK